MRGFKCSDILDARVDALIYSTNVLLNCTGGVGGALLARYGPTVQTTLHSWLSSRGVRFATQGDVIDLVSEGLPYRHVIHTVPCDGMYETSREMVTQVLTSALEMCASDSLVKTVALSALATGYGRLPFDDFLPLAAIVMQSSKFNSLTEVMICLEHAEDYERAEELNAELNLGLVAFRK